MGCSWTAPKCESPRSSIWPNPNVSIFSGNYFGTTLNCHITSTVNAFDLIPKLRARPEYQLSSGTKYINGIKCDLDRHYIDKGINQSIQNNPFGPQSSLIKYKFMTWIWSLFCLQMSSHLFVCLSVCLSVCSLLRYRLNVFLPPLPKVGCPKLVSRLKIQQGSGGYYLIFLVSVVLSASVKRCFVSRMRDFGLNHWFLPGPPFHNNKVGDPRDKSKIGNI